MYNCVYTFGNHELKFQPKKGVLIKFQRKIMNLQCVARTIMIIPTRLRFLEFEDNFKSIK